MSGREATAIADAIAWARQSGDGTAFLVVGRGAAGRMQALRVQLTAAGLRTAGSLAVLGERELLLHTNGEPVEAFQGCTVDAAFVGCDLPPEIAEEIARRLPESPTATADPHASLRALLGSDWTWTLDVVNAVQEVRHDRGLWFRVSTLGASTIPADAARVVADAVLDAVEAGIKGEVVLEVSKTIRAGSQVGKSWPPREVGPLPSSTWTATVRRVR